MNAVVDLIIFLSALIACFVYMWKTTRTAIRENAFREREYANLQLRARVERMRRDTQYRRQELGEELDQLYEEITNRHANQAVRGRGHLFETRTVQLFREFDDAVKEADKKEKEKKKRREARLLKKVTDGVAQDREEYKKKYGGSQPEN